MDSREIKQIMDSIEDLILTSSILAFDNWTDPNDFYTLTVKERRALLVKMRPLAVAPTRTNQWIWFGSYEGASMSARHGREGVPRILNDYFTKYDLSRGAKFRNLYSATPSDVNPFKFMPSIATFKGRRVQQLQTMVGLQEHNELVQKKTEGKIKADVVAAIEVIKETYSPEHGLDDYDYLVNMLNVAGVNQMIAGLAIAEFAKTHTVRNFIS